MANEMPASSEFSGLSQVVIAYSEAFAALADRAKTGPLTDADWAEVDAAFEGNQDPLSNKGAADATYARLFTRIVMTAPEPLGLGGAMRHSH